MMQMRAEKFQGSKSIMEENQIDREISFSNKLKKNLKIVQMKLANFL